MGTATKNTDSATQKTAPPSEAAKPPEKPPETTKKAIPDSIKALQEKIQPPNVSGQELPALVTTSDATIKSFVDAILAGKKEDAYKLLLGNKEYEEIVSEGLKSILGVGLIQHNKEVIDQLIESLQGQKLEKLEWKPGTAAYSKPPKTFRQRLPLISTSELLITVAGGVLIQLNVEQMIYHNNMWKVFRVTIP